MAPSILQAPGEILMGQLHQATENPWPMEKVIDGSKVNFSAPEHGLASEPQLSAHREGSNSPALRAATQLVCYTENVNLRHYACGMKSI